MRARSIFAATVSVALMLTGCAFHTGTGTAAGMLPALSAAADAIGPEAKLKISGKYKGSAKWEEGTKEQSASLTMTIKQHGKSISGSFDLTKGSHHSDLSIKGRVTSKAAKKATLKLDLIDSKGRSAQATATITGKSIAGTGNVPASGSNPSVSITFDGKRKAKHKE